MAHVPVLQKEVIAYLDPKPNENFIDCTLGGGGHAIAILEKTGPRGKVLGIDADPEALKSVGQRKRLIPACDNFRNLKDIAAREEFKKVSGILLDLGLSSLQLEESGRGFSFRKKEPLDMRFNPQEPLTAERIVNYWSFQDIERILKEYGEEQFSQNIAKKIIEARKIRPIKTTAQLVEIIGRIPRARTFGSVRARHPATKTFQALRIAVNDELNSLKAVLPQALEILDPGGRMAVISFHSLEDRIVKQYFKEQFSLRKLNILSKKPIVPKEDEIKINPRSRSAKLRAIQKI